MDLYEKLRKIEALIKQGSSEGEQQAALQAKQRILERIDDEPIKYKVSCRSTWEKRLFVAICSKHGYPTFRYHRQKHTTSNVTVSEAVMDKILWPEYKRYAGLLRQMVDDITGDLIDKIYHSSEDETVISGEIVAAT